MRIGAIAVALSLSSACVCLAQPAPPPAAAQPNASHLRAADRLLDAMQFDQYLTTMPSWDSKRVPMLGELLERPEVQKQFAELKGRIQAALPKIRAQVAAVLAARFTERELGELRRQALTPAGAKYARQKSAIDFEVGMALVEQTFLEIPELKKALQSQRDAAEMRKTEFNYLLSRADGGEAAAQQQVSVRYCAGTHPDAKGKVDLEKCERYRLLAAEGGDATAQYALAQLYLQPTGGRAREPQKGLDWLRKAGDSGNGFAKLASGRLLLGLAMFGTGLQPSNMPEIVNSAEGEKILRALAEAGIVGAQNTLWEAYLSGTGLPKNPPEAVNMLRLAADKGNRPAMQRLADLYFEGNGVARSPDEALRWYRLSLGKK
jgi:TPR repeat protein